LSQHLIAGLDIGTTKICCITAELGEYGELLVSGIGIAPSTGVKRGIVVDLDSTVKAIEEAVGKAARQSGREIAAVQVGVTGEHIASLNSSGRIAITHPDREINSDDVERVLEASRVIVVPPDRVILHAIPRAYTVDGHNGIRQPIGMSGSRLEVDTHIVTGTQTFLQNVEKCVTRAGLAIDDMVLEPLATAEAVMMPAEKTLGGVMVDIGGGTSDIAVFQEGEIFYSAVVPVGGNHVTSDIAQLLRMPLDEAEKLKIEHGAAQACGISDEETISITQIGRDDPRKLKRKGLCEIIEARMQELFHLVQKELQKSGCAERLSAGLILTGGGSQLRGAAECAGKVLGIPVRIGKPGGVAGLGDSVQSPVYATAVGLVQYAVRRQKEHRRRGLHGSRGSVMHKLNNIFSRFRTD
jgi:cell division protein FtsA